jgi:hypothetical protein
MPEVKQLVTKLKSTECRVNCFLEPREERHLWRVQAILHNRETATGDCLVSSLHRVADVLDWSIRAEVQSGLIIIIPEIIYFPIEPS